MKGILLAGGTGSRLYPVTHALSKHLLPIYDKPMVYYPLSTLMLTGVRDILLISTPQDLSMYERLLGNGNQFGVNIQYAVQPRPEGIAQAFLIGKKFLDGSSVCLILGDNIFYGHGLPEMLQSAVKRTEGATIFGYRVRDPWRYGVIDFDNNGSVISIEEKPKQPKSDYAVVGLYFYDSHVIDIAENLKPSLRGELEITDVNRAYLKQKKLYVDTMGRGIAWLDTGTHESLLLASSFVETIQNRQGQYIACLEEIAFTLGYITAEQVFKQADAMGQSEYGNYLKRIISERS